MDCNTRPLTLPICCVDSMQVVVGAGDPNPLVGGAGIATLRKAAVEVVEGVEAAACQDINRGWMERMRAAAAAAAAADAANAAVKQ